MPTISTLFLPSTGATPVKATFSHSKKTNESIKNTFNTFFIAQQSDGSESTSIVVVKCGDKLLCSSGGNVLNEFATLLNKGNKVYGSCFLINEDEKGDFTSVTNQTLQEVGQDYYNQYKKRISGIKGKKKAPSGLPKRPKKASEYYKNQFFTSRKQTLAEQQLKFVLTEETKAAETGWKALSPEEKSPYMAQEAADKARYTKEMEEYRAKNPVKPTKARSAAFFYNAANPRKKKTDESDQDEERPNFSSLTDEAKRPFEEKAKQDLERFEAENTVYKKHCEETGVDPLADTVVRRKRPATTSSNPTKKRKGGKKGEKAEMF